MRGGGGGGGGGRGGGAGGGGGGREGEKVNNSVCYAKSAQTDRQRQTHRKRDTQTDRGLNSRPKNTHINGSRLSKGR